MRVEELIIDGFKSYSTRTVISGWDPSFNAITGLNGSGKSNILDAICFVLGITNMSTVRAANLQDLIYKRGQAGVTRASVTIVFNNEDKASSPVSFENCKQVTVTRQVMMGGMSKYLINGHKAQQQMVQNLFQSVQLNINNPNFLIMQGKITKVLNMKPQEILGMIEEAAGTRMFEERKEKAIRTIGKKTKKVEEINLLLKEEIEPKLERLRGEKKHYLEYQKVTAELERASRVLIVSEWRAHTTRLANFSGELAVKREKAAQLQARQLELDHNLRSIESRHSALQKQREAETNKNGKMQALENQCRQMTNDLARAVATNELKKSSIAEDEGSLSAKEDKWSRLQESLQQFEAERDARQTACDTAKVAYDAAAVDLDRTDGLLQTLIAGVSSSEGDRNGFMDQIQQARDSVTQAGAVIEATKLQIEHCQRELEIKRPRAKEAESQAVSLTEGLARVKETLTHLRERRSKMTFDQESYESLLETRTQLNERKVSLDRQIAQLKQGLTSIDFSYSTPYPGFDKSAIKGLVINLIRLDHPTLPKAAALEVTAGNRLYNVVVDTESVGKDILEHGQLSKRVTIIPLNKISSVRASHDKIQQAKILSPGKVDLALELIEFEQDVIKAMTYVFGNTLICEDAETARKVTFHPKVWMKSVTLEGDIYDPSGTLSGGSQTQGKELLKKMHELQHIRSQLLEVEERIAAVDEQLKILKDSKTAQQRLHNEIEIKDHELQLLQAQCDGNSATRIVNEVAVLESQVSMLREKIKSAKADEVVGRKLQERLTQDAEDYLDNGDKKLTQIKASIAIKKKDLAVHWQKLKKHQMELSISVAAVSEAREEQQILREETQQLRMGLQEQRRLLIREDQVVETLSRKVRDIEQSLSEQQNAICLHDNEMASLVTQIASISHQIAETTLEIQTINHELERCGKERSDIERALEVLQQQHEWLQTYDHSASASDLGSTREMADVRRRCRALEEQQTVMRKKVNPKVMDMIGNVEKKESALQEMMGTILKDKTKIEDTIASLDLYKHEALRTTSEKVTKDFGEIFAELLPGNFALLQAPEGQEIWQGLEVKVRLGQVWKQSLTELSGGQRSLIALSLIMSLLQYKPAPMYILDEVDAALDPSHTQNIGHLLRTRFKGSQFIVVSLKDGMFNNANVLFQTRFRDGTSIVERTSTSHNQGLRRDKENRPPFAASKPQKA